MKPFYAPVLLTLLFLAGCAKNSEVASLRSQVAALQEQVAENLESNRMLQQKIEGLEAANVEREAAAHDERSARARYNDLINDSLKRTSVLELKLETDSILLSQFSEDAKGILKGQIDLNERVGGQEALRRQLNDQLGELKVSTEGIETRIRKLERNLNVIANQLGISPLLLF